MVLYSIKRFMGRRHNEVKSEDLQGFKYFKLLAGMIETLHDAACQAKENRQGEETQDESRTSLPGACHVIGRQRGDESSRPGGGQGLFHGGVCHGPIRVCQNRSRHLARVKR